VTGFFLWRRTPHSGTDARLQKPWKELLVDFHLPYRKKYPDEERREVAPATIRAMLRRECAGHLEKGAPSTIILRRQHEI